MAKIKSSNDDDYAIKAEGIKKTFRLPHEKQNSIKGLFVSMFRRKQTYEKQQVLRGVSFEVKKGEFFGIVGRNGSGKSTLLKLLAGIYTPDKGQIQTNGRLIPFIELGVGFNPELTGRENVFLNGALLGFSRKDMLAMYDEIVSFAELGRFMDQKLKNYSSGMQVRLAFSIAIRAQGDILVLDEVLAVGDEAFQRKCNEYFLSLKKTDQTIILVTHDMGAVRKYCSNAILIENGKITMSGEPEDIANQYTLDNFKSLNETRGEETEYPAGLSELVPTMEIKPVSKQILKSKDTFEFDVIYEVTEDIPVNFGISVIDEASGGVTSVFNDHIQGKDGKLATTSTKKGKYSFRYRIPLSRFNNRNFMITATVRKVVDRSLVNIAYTAGDRIGRFAIRGEKFDSGLLKEKGEWVSKI
jgi:ABC-2 type transport system ATP-binding protein